MTIERFQGSIEAVCDDCGNSIGPYDSDDWDILMGKVRDSGWKITKEGGQWEHYCEDCRYDATNGAQYSDRPQHNDLSFIESLIDEGDNGGHG